MLLTVAHAQSLQSCLVLCNCMAVACQASLSMKFSRQESWSKLPYPSPEYILNPRSKPVSLTSPVLVGGFFTTSATNCSIQSLSCVRLSVTPWTATHQTSLCFTISWSLLQHVSTEVVIPFNHLILWGSLLFLPSVFPNRQVHIWEWIQEIVLKPLPGIQGFGKVLWTLILSDLT